MEGEAGGGGAFVTGGCMLGLVGLDRTRYHSCFPELPVVWNCICPSLVLIAVSFGRRRVRDSMLSSSSSFFISLQDLQIENLHNMSMTKRCTSSSQQALSQLLALQKQKIAIQLFFHPRFSKTVTKKQNSQETVLGKD